VVLRHDHKAGEKTFVDWAGDTVAIHDRASGETAPASIFVAVLGASTYTFARAALSQDLSNWIDCHVRAFEFFQGVTRLLVPDNPRTGVTRACRYEPDLNRTYHEMAQHYGIAVLPARPYKPRDKAKVENAVGIVERWILAALRHRKFFAIAELNEAIDALLDGLNSRRFRKREGTRTSLFLEMDRPALQPLPAQRSRDGGMENGARQHRLPRRGLDRKLLRSLSASEWVRQNQNVLFIGPTGIGKSWLACALAHKACRDGFSVLHKRTTELFRELAVAHVDGSIGRVLLKLARVDVLVLDDFAMAPLKDSERRDFLEICDDRYQRRSIVLTSQMPIAHWHEQIGDPTIADSILDRLVHNAFRIELSGESIRKKRGRKPEEPPS
jgi:hypothetical protein